MARKKAKTPSSPKKLTQSTLLNLPGSPTISLSSVKHASSLPLKPSLKTFSDRDEDSSDGVGEIRFEKDIIDLSSEDDQPRLSPMKKRRVGLASDESSQASRVATPENSEPHDGETSSQVRWRGKVKGKQRRVDDSDSEGEKNSKRRRLVRGVRPPSPDDDDDFLDEIDENQILDNRMRRRDNKSIFQQNLERLKRRKQGKLVSESSQPEEESGSDGDGDKPFEGAKPDDDYDCDASDEQADEGLEEESFIIEDDNAVVPQLPAMFSMNTHQDLAHHFKIICQLFVHLAVCPVKQRQELMMSVLRDNEYFSLPLQIARRKLSGLRDSLVASSVWRPEFKKALEIYPNLNVTMLDFAVPSCDACHLGGRMSTRIGRLSGSPYDDMGYKSQTPDDSESEDNDDVKGKPRREFHLGRFCAKRTQVYHQFTHWEYDLFKSLRREVDELRHSNSKRGFVRVAFAGGIRPPENSKDADSIMDWLDERKIIEIEWVKVNDMMERARNLDMAAKKGEGD